jgi:hypothetical protein
MADYTITLTDREDATLRRLAQDAGVPFGEYARNIIKNWLRGQLRGLFQEEFNQKTEDELEALFGPVV